MGKSLVDLTQKDGIGIITIDHPPVNALNKQVLQELSQVIEALEKREDFLVLILTGAGEKAFVGGADIREFLELTQEEGEEMVSIGQGIFSRIEALSFPVLAAINGFALGGGCELALSCDIRVMADTARLGLPEVNLGLIPGYGGTQRLSRLIPVGKAKELIYTGEMIGAKEALHLGLVEKVVPSLDLMEVVKEMAKRILGRGPLAVMGAKKAINMGLELSLVEGLEVEKRLFAELCATEDMKEGAYAFLEKRAPLFKGR